MPHNSTYPAATIAKYFIRASAQEGKPITNKKLQKLLYYSQAWSLAARGKKLFDEKIEAWIHGPAIPEVYHQYKNFGADPITEEVKDIDVAALETEDRALLDEIWSVYGTRFDGDYLENLTHSEAPWIDARQGLEANVSSTNEITPESMREFFAAKLQQNRA